MCCDVLGGAEPFRFSYLKDAKNAPKNLTFDYIIVGGGTAGCPLAATLSEKYNVLVLERGGSPYGNRNVERLGNFVVNLMDSSPTSPAQQFKSTDGVQNHRGRVLGGSSAINAGFYSRAEDLWVERVGLDKNLVEESYKWVEKAVVFEPQRLQWQTAMYKGLLEVGITPDNGFTLKHLKGTKTGGTIFNKQNHRCTAADLIASYANYEKITVILFAIVHRIIFDKNVKGKPTAIGVMFKDSLGRIHTANIAPKGEIILSAGAIGSPQLMILSGIGPKHQLDRLGLNVILEQPMVGQNMSDNPMNAVAIPANRDVEMSLVDTVGIVGDVGFIEGSSGGYLPGFEGIMPSLLPSAITKTPLFRGGVILEKIKETMSMGWMEVKNTNADDTPEMTFNYFKEKADLDKCVAGCKVISRVIDSKAFTDFRLPMVTGNSVFTLNAKATSGLTKIFKSFSYENFCRDTVKSIWHYHAGCEVDHVIDKDYKVIGVDNLRIVDGSTFRYSPGTNPQATVMMLGRYVGVKMLAERK